MEWASKMDVLFTKMDRAQQDKCIRVKCVGGLLFMNQSSFIWTNSLGTYCMKLLCLDVMCVLDLCGVLPWKAKEGHYKSCPFRVSILIYKILCLYFILCLCLSCIRLVISGLISRRTRFWLWMLYTLTLLYCILFALLGVFYCVIPFGTLFVFLVCLGESICWLCFPIGNWMFSYVKNTFHCDFRWVSLYSPMLQLLSRRCLVGVLSTMG